MASKQKKPLQLSPEHCRDLAVALHFAAHQLEVSALGLRKLGDYLHSGANESGCIIGILEVPKAAS